MFLLTDQVVFWFGLDVATKAVTAKPIGDIDGVISASASSANSGGNRLVRRLKDRPDLLKYRIWKKTLAPQC